ncbi:hypothetical protein [Poseidonocella sp. HB161398]|uniref:hypothetical protein n=1 Tax=Poseidonocella sp. HB161398 TaxID=2320855 RepID=UPI0011080B36|nr:hypothetical protein [Poseidonocella sp. HB161398]
MSRLRRRLLTLAGLLSASGIAASCTVQDECPTVRGVSDEDRSIFNLCGSEAPSAGAATMY